MATGEPAQGKPAAPAAHLDTKDTMTTTQTGPGSRLDAVPRPSRVVAGLVGVISALAVGWPVFHAVQDAAKDKAGPQPTVVVSPTP